MCRTVTALLLAAFSVASVRADDCEAIVAEFELPVKLKTRGKTKVGKWEKVDEILNGVGKVSEKSSCEFLFGQLFRNKKEDELFLPLTNTVLRVVPEESLSGIEVFSKDGEPLGVYANRFSYERSGGLHLKKSYSIYYFQYLDLADKLQSVRRKGLLLDDFVVRWTDIKDKLAVSGK
jgi:hypothetical protein